VESNKAKSFFC